MQHRIIGVAIVALSSYALYLGIRGWFGAADFTDFMVTLAQFNHLAVDRGDFLSHWRVASIVVISVATLGIVAGVAMFLLRPWSWLLLAGIALGSLLLSVGAAISGYPRYGFETFDRVESLLLLLLGLVSLYVFHRWPPVRSHASDA
jgi:hypothetical protein